jgi:uncharacterized protein (DUF849 family)
VQTTPPEPDRPEPGPQRLKVCLNGARQRIEHPAVPCTPAELTVAARDAVRAGAEAVHLHPRAADGTETLRATQVGAAVAAVRAGSPGVPVGVSTGLWITAGDIGRRQSQVAEWAGLDRERRPDFASVNLSEPGSGDLLRALAEADIAAEAGVWSSSDVRALADSLDRGVTWLRVLVEILPGPDLVAAGPIALADRLLSAVRVIDPRLSDGRLPVLLHGEEHSCWPLIRHAGRLGLPTRIGLEDALTGPNAEPIRDNAHLVELALTTWAAG